MDSSKLEEKWIEIKEELLKLDALKEKMGDSEYIESYLNWIKETIIKNRFLYESKYDTNKTDQELFKKSRQNVYWINFGVNIGSEFQGYHYAVVVYESTYTAIVVPLSSEKEEIQSWKDNNDLIIPIGEITDFEDTKPCYALINQIQVVSKKRLDRIGTRPNYKKIKLSSDQMNLIDDAITKTLTKQIICS